jgi:hypothetical protein
MTFFSRIFRTQGWALRFVLALVLGGIIQTFITQPGLAAVQNTPLRQDVP